MKLLQILRYLKSIHMPLDKAIEHINDIIDNNNSEYFILNDFDIELITEKFYNDDVFESIVHLSGY